MWGSTFPLFVITDSRPVTRFFHTEIITRALWNACVDVLKFNYYIAHVAAAMNTVENFLSQTGINLTKTT